VVRSTSAGAALALDLDRDGSLSASEWVALEPDAERWRVLTGTDGIQLALVLDPTPKLEVAATFVRRGAISLGGEERRVELVATAGAWAQGQLGIDANGDGAISWGSFSPEVWYLDMGSELWFDGASVEAVVSATGERLALTPGGEAPPRIVLGVGDKLPDELNALGAGVVVFTHPGCGFSRSLMDTLHARDDVVEVFEGDMAAWKAWRREDARSGVTPWPKSTAWAARYGIHGSPVAMVVDEAGTLLHIKAGLRPIREVLARP
jgi:hypothetical protein